MTVRDIKLILLGYRWCPCHRMWSLYRCAELEDTGQLRLV